MARLGPLLKLRRATASESSEKPCDRTLTLPRHGCSADVARPTWLANQVGPSHLRSAAAPTRESQSLADASLSNKSRSLV